jgi:hypothetical protein
MRKILIAFHIVLLASLIGFLADPTHDSRYSTTCAISSIGIMVLLVKKLNEISKYETIVYKDVSILVFNMAAFTAIILYQWNKVANFDFTIFVSILLAANLLLIGVYPIMQSKLR